MISKGGEYSRTAIGRDFKIGQVPQFIVSAGNCFASQVASIGDYSLWFLV